MTTSFEKFVGSYWNVSPLDEWKTVFCQYTIVCIPDAINDWVWVNPILGWCDINCKHDWNMFNVAWFAFEDKEEAMLFKLSWL